jgi:surfactin family lipopeptide synthetase A
VKNLSLPEITIKIQGFFENILGFPLENNDDNFFKLGGNSIQALEIVNHVNEAFSLDLTIMDFFENLSISSLSKNIFAKIA